MILKYRCDSQIGLQIICWCQLDFLSIKRLELSKIVFTSRRQSNLKMKFLNSIILCWSFLVVKQIMAFELTVKRGGAEALKPFLTNQLMNDILLRKIALSQRVTLTEKVRNSNLRNVLAYLRKNNSKVVERTKTRSNRLNGFKRFHHWFFFLENKNSFHLILSIYWFRRHKASIWLNS